MSYKKYEKYIYHYITKIKFNKWQNENLRTTSSVYQPPFVIHQVPSQINLPDFPFETINFYWINFFHLSPIHSTSMDQSIFRMFTISYGVISWNHEVRLSYMDCNLCLVFELTQMLYSGDIPFFILKIKIAKTCSPLL